MNPLISILSMLGTLAIAYGLDYGYFFVRRYATQMGKGELLFIDGFLGGLILCAVWITLGWIVKVKGQRSITIALVYIFIGFIAFSWFPLSYLVPRLLANSYLAVFLFPNQPLNFQYSGLFILVIGVLILRSPKHDNIS